MFRARTTFWAGTRLVREGDLVDGKDPVVKGRDAIFEKVGEPEASPRVVLGGVEQATSAPGERRSVSRPRKRAAKKAAAPKSDAPKAD